MNPDVESTQVMFSHVRSLLSASPFRPFEINMTSGQRYPVPEPDAAKIDDESKVVHVRLVRNGTAVAFGSHIESITVLLPPA